MLANLEGKIVKQIIFRFPLIFLDKVKLSVKGKQNVKRSNLRAFCTITYIVNVKWMSSDVKPEGERHKRKNFIQFLNQFKARTKI